MKILNPEKTHFMRPDKHGEYTVKFGKVEDVHAAIDEILDGEIDARLPINHRTMQNKQFARAKFKLV